MDLYTAESFGYASSTNWKNDHQSNAVVIDIKEEVIKTARQDLENVGVITIGKVKKRKLSIEHPIDNVEVKENGSIEISGDVMRP